jgi:hypothetical protein
VTDFRSTQHQKEPRYSLMAKDRQREHEVSRTLQLQALVRVLTEVEGWAHLEPESFVVATTIRAVLKETG